MLQVTDHSMLVSRVSDGVVLIEGPLPTFESGAACGANYFGIAANFTTTNSPKWYGLGQLESETQAYCTDSSHESELCGTPLLRNSMSNVDITSLKYHIAIPWLYNRAEETGGWGIFLNQPGDGSVSFKNTFDPKGEGLELAFACQKQLDMWVSVGSADNKVDSAANPAAAVYEQYAR